MRQTRACAVAASITMESSLPQYRSIAGLLAFVAALLCGTAAVAFPLGPQTQLVAARADDHLLRVKQTGRPSVGPTLVTDLRIRSYPERVRFVFDLQHGVKFSQVRKKRPDRILIELQNTKLTKTVRAKISDRAFPADVTITQPSERSVRLVLDLAKISDYKLLPLKDPDRLVLEVYYPTDPRQEQPMPKEAAPEPAPAPLAGLKDNQPKKDDQPKEDAPVAAPPASPAQPVEAPPQAAVPQIKALRRPARDDIKTIVIDPGHGGKDPGAIGPGKTREKAITLKVGLKLKDLIAQRLGLRVLMTRDRDTFIELDDRTKYANRHDADLFVSIHVNSHPQRSTKGLEIYHFGKASDRRALEVAARENGTPIESTGVGWQYLVADLLTDKKIQDSLELAWTARQAMVGQLNGYYDLVDLGVKTAPFYVLRFTTMPSILAEIGFISNPTEERLMQTDAFLTRMAEAIFQGVHAFIHPSRSASG